MLVIGLLAAVGAVLLGSEGAGGEGGRLLTIKSLKGQVLVHDLSRDVEIEVDGLIGTTLVAVEGGQAAFKSSPCPHKVCIRKGRIGRSGEWVLCLPNGVMAEISGDGEYDGITP
jgi:hypothetical protein